MIFIIVFTAILLVLAVVEQARHKKNIEKIRIRILVNGTRGKSSVVRLINAALNYCGIKSIAKSTGSEASFIMSNLDEIPIDRRRGRNTVREQRRLFELAVRENCEAVVCECSAVSPENQRLYAEKTVIPTHVAITNIREDHIDVMGDDARAVIMLCVPDGLEPIMTEEPFRGSFEGFGFSAHPENIALALEVCKKLGLDGDMALEGMKNARGDIGMTGIIPCSGKTVVNGFAVNDPQSARDLFKDRKPEDVTVVFANRADREFRIESFCKLFDELGVRDVRVIGDNRKKCAKMMNAESYGDNDFDALIDSAKDTIVGCGNIGGSGMKFLKYCMEIKER